ncbi:MAG: hypothetical protein AB1391_01260 [Candidatus Micrarchaeota archaeon]
MNNMKDIENMNNIKNMKNTNNTIMNMKSSVFVCLFVLLFILSGCYAPNMQGPCCTINTSNPNTVKCMLTNPVDPTTSIAPSPEMCNGSIVSNGLMCNTDWCATAEPSQNETIYVKYDINGRHVLNCTGVSLSNKSEPCNNIGYCHIIFTNITNNNNTYAFYPQCSNRAELAFDTNCKTMLCGNIQYSPKQSLLPEYGKNMTYQNLKTTATQMLYAATCNFYTLDAPTMKKLKRAKDVFVNTFRIGFGNSISDFEEARLYFPLSDKFCRTAQGKDRYMNYLNVSFTASGYFDWWQYYSHEKWKTWHADNVTVNSFDPSTIINRSVALGCNTSVRNLSSHETMNYKEFPPAASSGNYFLKIFNESYIPATYIMPDTERYKYELYRNYWDKIYKTNLNDSAPTLIQNFSHFECNSSFDCVSGLCTKQDSGYERGFCTRSDGNVTNCMCYEVGSRLRPGNEVRCEAFENSNTFRPLTTNLCEIRYHEKSGSCKKKCEGFPPECTRTCSGYKPKTGCSGFFYVGDTCTYDEPYMNCTDIINAPQIVFFNQTIEGYKGYARMNEPEFQRSMLAASCGPFVKGTDYNVANYLPDYNIATNKDRWACANSEWRTKGVCTKTYKELILFKTLGKCTKDDQKPEANFLNVSNVYGWCEPCTHATMVSVNLDDYYKAYNGYYFGCYSSYPGGESCGCGAAVGGLPCGTMSNYMDSVANIRTRIDNYLKTGVMPIIWYMSNSSNLGTTWTYSGGYYTVCHRCNNAPTDAARTTIINTLKSYNPIYSADSTNKFFDNFNAWCYYNDWTSCSCHNKPCECSGPYQAKQQSSNPSGETYIGERTENKEALSFKCHACDHHAHDTFCNWGMGYHFLKNAIGNSASIVVIASSVDGKNATTIATRATQLKTENCPNCLAALYVPKMNTTRLDEIFGCTDQYNCKIRGNDAWKNIDIILYDDRINDYTGIDRNLAILEGVANKSRQLLLRYSKPSIPLISIDDSYLGWSLYNNTFEAMKYLLENQTELINSGAISLYFRTWYGSSTNTSTVVTAQNSTNRLPTSKDEKFCGIERAMVNYLYQNLIKTVYNKITAVNLSDAKCEECTSTDHFFGLCNRTCENGVECELSPNMDANNARCPRNTVINPCTLCNDSIYSNRIITCNYSYSDGTIDSHDYTYNDFSTISTFDMYADIISSLPKQDKCCMASGDEEGTQQNYTYIKISGEGTATNPIRFAAWGNETIDCSMNTDTSSFCNITLPIKNYKINCAVQK